MSTDYNHLQPIIDPEINTLMGDIAVDDLTHAVHVSRLAMELFHITWPMHGFDATAASLLRRAALLHDAGILISYSGHHKETLRLVTAGHLPGISGEQQREVACIARYHRKALPHKRHPVYGDLPRESRQLVDELGGILRLADAFDYEHDGSVLHLYGHVLSTPDKATQILIRASHRITDHAVLQRIVERANVKRDLFERAFHCRVIIAPEYPSDTREASLSIRSKNGFAAH